MKISTEHLQRCVSTAHDYGEGFAEDTLQLLPQFILDVDKLIEVLNNVPD